MTVRNTILAAVLAAAGTAVWAGDLQVQQYKGHRYVTGGVGATEQEAMRKAAAEYNLGLTFAGTKGRYVADVEVKVKDQSGEIVLAAIADGPMLLADLPRGRYTVEATFNGETHSRQVSLPDDGHRRVVMSWSLPDSAPAAPGKTPQGSS